jgi:hypothetical protein
MHSVSIAREEGDGSENRSKIWIKFYFGIVESLTQVEFACGFVTEFIYNISHLEN